jgi:hypothetical protein
MRREKLQFIYLKSTFAWDALCSGLGKRSGMYKEPPGLVRVVDNLFIQLFFFLSYYVLNYFQVIQIIALHGTHSPL